MIKKIVLILAFAITFCLGLAFKSIISNEKNNNKNMKRVTGVGGIFFKCKDPKKMTEWYEKHLGLTANPYGATFEWYESPDSTSKAQTQWTPFAETSKYFDGNMMINYRVDNLELLIEELKKEGVTIVDEMATYDYGKFVHILDAEGNKVELWEAID